MDGRSVEISFPDFQRYFPRAPTALCIKECARLTALRAYDCLGPILDVGCGDGLFASIAFADAEVWGIDIDAHERRWAVASRAYEQVILGDITCARLPDGFFQSCVANSSLEHVPRIDLALENILKSLRPGARMFMFVPNRDWASRLLSARVLESVGARRLGRAIQDGIDRVFNHRHLHDAEGWRQLVARAGFEVEEVKPVLSTATTMAFEAFLVPSLLGLLNKTLTTRWTNFPRARRHLAGPIFSAAQSLLAVGDARPTAEFLVVGQRPVVGA